MGKLFGGLVDAKRKAVAAGQPADYHSLTHGAQNVQKKVAAYGTDPIAPSVNAQVIRERFKRTLMATKARSNYKFKNPEVIVQKYGAPSAIDVGQVANPGGLEKRLKPFAGNQPK